MGASAPVGLLHPGGVFFAFEVLHMFRSNKDAGDAGNGSFGFPHNSNGYRYGRGRLRGDDFGLTARPSLLGLARTYLETQARLWPELAGTPAVPAVTDATVEAMADDFERRFRTQSIDVFSPAGLRRVWTDIGLGYVPFSDEGRSSRRSRSLGNSARQRLVWLRGRPYLRWCGSLA